jgi:hypothetical protein
MNNINPNHQPYQTLFTKKVALDTMGILEQPTLPGKNHKPAREKREVGLAGDITLSDRVVEYVLPFHIIQTLPNC